MFEIVKNTKIDFMSPAPVFAKVSIAACALSLVAIFGFPGIKFGLDFSGGHEVLVSFGEQVEINKVRSAVEGLALGDTSVQSYEVPEDARTYFLVKVQRSATFGDAELKELEGAFSAAYGAQFKQLRYNAEAGDVVDVEFVKTATSQAGYVATSSASLIAVVEKTNHKVRDIDRIGRPDEERFAVVLRGIDVSIIEVLREKVSADVQVPQVGFVGPTVGKQLRNDGILACLYALLIILIYVAFRFDFFYSPGAILCLFHDALVTCGLLTLIGHEFSLSTIAGLLTLIGYSINDTIIIFDRVRETVGNAQGAGLKEVLNRAINETLARTIMTTGTTALACVCLMFFGRRTVLFDFGLIMSIGVIVGTYSSIYVASPVFWRMRTRFGQEVVVKGAKPGKASKKAAAAT